MNQRIQIATLIIFAFLVVIIAIMGSKLVKNQELNYIHSEENFKKLQRIEENMRYIENVSRQIDSVMQLDAQKELRENQNIEESNNFVNQIPHLADDTLSILYGRSYLFLRDEYRGGRLRPTN